MKFIYLTTKNYPGTTADHAYIKELARAFEQELGDDFTMVVANDAKQEFTKERLIDLGIPPGASKLGRVIRWLPAFLWKTLRRGKDVVFFSNDPYLLTLLIVLKKTGLFSFVVCSDWHMLFRDWRDRFVARQSDHLITTCQRLKDQLIQKTRVSEQRIHVVYGGVHPEHSEVQDKHLVRQKLGLPSDAFLVGYVGYFKTLGMEKGMAMMVRALPFMDQNIHVVLVGARTDKEIAEYQEIALRLGVEHRCHVIEKQSFERVTLYEQAMDVLTIPYPDLPHFRDFGFPMKLYEYLAVGVPIVFSKLGLVEEVIADQSLGFLPDDSQDFVRCVHAVFHHSIDKNTYRQQMGDLSRFYWRTKAKTIIKAIS